MNEELSNMYDVVVEAGLLQFAFGVIIFLNSKQAGKSKSRTGFNLKLEKFVWNSLEYTFLTTVRWM